jgi:hypothetical protein
MIFIIELMSVLIMSAILYIIWNFMLTPVFPHITFVMSIGIALIFSVFSNYLINKNYNYLLNKK